MALNFPDSPTNGQKYTDATTGETWTYEASTNSWTSDGLTTASGIQYKGGLDITTAPPAGAASGWQYTVTTGGTANAGFTGLTGSIPAGTTILYDGTNWQQAGAGVKWDRTGTALKPVNAGDTVQISAGTAALPGLTPVGDADSGLFSAGANQIGIATNGTGRLFVNSAGNVGIGTGSPAELLTVSEAIKYGNTGYITDGDLGSIYTGALSGTYGTVIGTKPGKAYSTSRNLSVSLNPVGGPGREVFRIEGQAGDVKIGGTLPASPNISLKTDGSATFAGTVTATVTPPSDARFKENITPANPQLADIVALGKQLKNFDWNDKAPLNDELRAVRQLGLIAQEAERVSPGIVKTIKRTKQGRELTPETVIPAVYKDVVDPQDEENFLQELVTPEQIIPATYEEVDDSFKGISHDALIMKLLGAVAELSAEVEALKAAK